MLCSNAMATLTTLWLMPVMMAGWCFSFKGPPVSPAIPDCHIPCDDSDCSGDIICTWDMKPSPNNNLTYTLHWEGFQTNVTGHRAVIQRNEFMSHSDLQVWVQTKDQDGKVSKSKKVTLIQGCIIKPPPPKIKSGFCEPSSLEIHWMSPCDHLMLQTLGEDHCGVRYRTEAQRAWLQHDGLSGSYTLNNPEAYTNYSFQVHCACGTSMMSEWSEVHTLRSAEKAPHGMLDAWRDCGMLPPSSECVLTWKTLPKSKARGHILGYNVILYFNDGYVVALNESVAASVRLVCNEVQCYYNFSLKDVKSIHIDTYNALGVTPLSQLDIQAPVKTPIHEDIYLEMHENNLTVNWNEMSQISHIKEFVVQYKEAGSPLGQGFDWIRLNTSLRNATMKGQFKKFTAYQVSVFAVLDHNKVLLYGTNVMHFVQGLPAKVPSFEALSCGTTHITLRWGTVLMSLQNGVMPYYQLGYGKGNVYNISAYPQLENRTITLDHLKEELNHEVWIKAVNQAGPGPKTTVMCSPSENMGAVTKFVFGAAGLLILLFTTLCYRGKKACPAVRSALYEKVPDPHNSNIFKEMTVKVNDSLAWLPIPEKEECPTISEIEIVKPSSFAFFSQTDNIKYGEGDNDPLEGILTEEHKKTHGRCGKQEYSKMVDSDEEQNEEDETGKSSWSSEEDNAGYEQHFMPTDLDLQEIEERERTVKKDVESEIFVFV